jgi:hypothetical protein
MDGCDPGNTKSGVDRGLSIDVEIRLLDIVA